MTTPPGPVPGRAMGVDLGARRIGVALCDRQRTMAFPWGAVERSGDEGAALDRLVEIAMESGAKGARLTGAGFGGCALIFCSKSGAADVARRVTERFYNDDPSHIIHAEPGPGALMGRAL